LFWLAKVALSLALFGGCFESLIPRQFCDAHSKSSGWITSETLNHPHSTRWPGKTLLSSLIGDAEAQKPRRIDFIVERFPTGQILTQS
jgi:hypothetical protein